MFKQWFNNLISINWSDEDLSNEITLFVFHYLRNPFELPSLKETFRTHFSRMTFTNYKE